MNMFEIYIIMQLDAIAEAFLALTLLLGTIILIYVTIICIESDFNPVKNKLKIFKLMLIVEFCLILLIGLIPNTKTAITMIVGEKITNNTDLIESANKGMKLLPKIIEEVDEYLEEKK